MTIYDIKRLTAETEPYFFSTRTMKFFGQTMRSFRVLKQTDGRYLITAPVRDNGRTVHETKRYFNPVNNRLEYN